MATTPSLTQIQAVVFGMLERGYRVIPIPRARDASVNGKRPTIKDWPNVAAGINQENFKEYFSAPCNIGLPLYGLVDLDLDSTEALSIAHLFFPATPCLWGRQSKRCSHRLYRPVGEIQHKAFPDPDKPAEDEHHMLLELRTDAGHQTVFPGSVHKSGELIEWNGTPFADPAEAPAVSLRKAGALCAVAALLARCHPSFDSSDSQIRQDYRLAVSGTLCRRLDLASAKLAWSGVLAAVGDPKWKTREQLIEDTDRDLHAGANVPGIPKLEQLIGAKRMEKILDWCAVVDPDRAVPGSSNTASTSQPTPKPTEWQEPQPIPSALSPVAELRPEMLPEAFRGFAMDIARRLPVQLDYAAIPLIGSVSAVLAPKGRVQAKRNDESFRERPILWAVPIGESGTKKTHAQDEAMAPAKEIDSELAQQFDTAEKEYAIRLEDYQTELDVWQRERRKVLHKRMSGESIDFTAPRPTEPEKPPRRQLYTNDCNAETLLQLVRDNGAVTFYRDELDKFLVQLEDPKEFRLRELLLGGHTASKGGSFRQDRKTVASTRAPEVCIGVMGSLHPVETGYYYRSVRKTKHSGDGFIQRAQLIVYPDALPEYGRRPDHREDSSAKRRVCDVVRRIAALERDSIRGVFDDAAQEEADKYEFYIRVVLKKCAKGKQDLWSHYAKYEGLFPRVAFLFAVVDLAARGHLGPGQVVIDLEHALQTKRFLNYLETHAERIYRMLVNPAHTIADALREKIEEGALPPGHTFTSRHIARRHWGAIPDDDAKLIREGLEVLSDYGWVANVSEEGKMGRPSDQWLVNPKGVKR